MWTLTNSAKLIEKIQNIKSVVTWSTAPSNPSAWDLWYDTTATVNALKMYNWSGWGIMWPEIVSVTQAEYEALSQAEKDNGKYYLITDWGWTVIWWNVKAFYLAWTTWQSNIDIAQEAVDWYVAWKLPIIVYNWSAYILWSVSWTTYYFASPKLMKSEALYSTIYEDTFKIYHSNNSVSSLAYEQVTYNYLDPTWEYMLWSFTPTVDWHPATKKYVDDLVWNVESLLAAI